MVSEASFELMPQPRIYFPPRIGQWEPVLIILEQRYRVHRLINGALLDREGRGGESTALDRPGPSGRGDDGHGHGLWQLDDRSHGTFLKERMPDGRFKWEDPLEAGDYAMRSVLMPAIRIFKGDIFLSLASYNAGIAAVRSGVAKAPPGAPIAVVHRAADTRTARGDYAQDVLYRAGCFGIGRDPYP